MTQIEAQNHFVYDPRTGALTWRHDRACGVRAGTEAGWIDPSGHRRLRVGGRRHLVHRVVWLYVYGEPVPKFIDHINRNPSDNRIENLRATTKSANRLNCNVSKNNKSGYTGVSFHAVTGKWRAVVAGRHLGVYDTPELAALARQCRGV